MNIESHSMMSSVEHTTSTGRLGSHRSSVRTRQQPKRQRTAASFDPSASSRSVLAARLELPKGLPAGWVIQTSARVMWSHLLYARGLLPLPVHQILDENPSETMRSSIARKLAQARTSVKQMANDWKLVESFCPEMKHILISLGPSWSSPKEYYLINVAKLTTSEEEPRKPVMVLGTSTSTQGNEKNEHALTRRLLMELMKVELNDCSPHKLAGSYQLFVSFCVSSKTADRIFHKKDDQLQSRLQVRHGFQLATKRRIYRQVEINLARKNMAVETETEDGVAVLETNMVDGDAMWISLRSTIKGFRG
jgi:hypothetical protein